MCLSLDKTLITANIIYLIFFVVITLFDIKIGISNVMKI